MDGFKSIEIRNFRGIGHLEIDDFSRVNVLLGQYGSGNSSVSGGSNHFINPNNQPAMGCWQTYEGELEKVRIPTKTPPTLTIPAKKTKIYAYLETLLGKSKTQKKLIKDANRNYENIQHWNLDAEYLEPLTEFLIKNLRED